MPQLRPLTLGVFALALGVYGATLMPTIPGGDAGELVVVADALAVAHPPGYPLWTLLAWLFAQLPLGSVAARVAWLSAACTAAAAAMVASCVAAFVRDRDATRPAIAGASGLLAAGLFAFSPTVWTYATGAEVFPLHGLFVALLFRLSFEWQRTHDPRIATAIAFTTGLGLANHHTLVFFAAPLAAWLLWSGRRVLLAPAALARLAAAGLAGLLPYAYLVAAGLRDDPVSWGDTATLQGFLDHLLRRDYGTFQLLPAGHAASSPRIAKVVAYFAHFTRASLGIGVALPAAAAALALAPRDESSRSKSRWILLPIGCALFYIAAFHALANVALGEPLLAQVLSRFWMQADLALSVAGGAGFGLLALRVPSLPRGAAWIAAAVIVVARVGLSGGERADRGGAVVESYGRAILEPLPSRALLLTQGDLVTNVVRYLQECERVRRDVVVLDQELLTRPWYVRRMARRHPDVRFPGTSYQPGAQGGFTMKSLLEANAEGRAIYVYPEWKAGDPSTSGAWTLWPEGLASRALPQSSPPPVPAWTLESASALAAVEARGWPPIPRYAAGTWERVALEDVWQARHRRAVFVLKEAIARGNDAALLTIARGELEAARRTHPAPPFQLFLNLGIVYERLALTSPSLRREQLAAWKRYLSAAPADDAARAAVAEAVARLEAEPATKAP